MAPDTLIVASSGVVFIITSIVIAVFFPHPSSFQLFVFRTVLALAAAAGASAISGLLSVDAQRASITLKASGAIAIFVVVYLVNPANLVTKKSKPHDRPDEPHYNQYRIDLLFRMFDNFGHMLGRIEETLKISGNTEKSNLFSQYVLDISDLIYRIATHDVPDGNSTEARDLHQLCGQLDEYILYFGQQWGQYLPPYLQERTRYLLTEGTDAPDRLRSYELTEADKQKYANALKEISGKFAAIARSLQAS